MLRTNESTFSARILVSVSPNFNLLGKGYGKSYRMSQRELRESGFHMESWTRHGESMPIIVCEVRVSNRFSPELREQHSQGENPYSGLAKDYRCKSVPSIRSGK